MSKNNRPIDSSESQRNLVANGHPLVSLAVNVGIAVFVTDGLWRLIRGPFETSTEHRLHCVLLYSGLGIAASAWVASSRAIGRLKRPLAVLILGGAFFAAAESIQQFDSGERELLRGTVSNGRVVYEGLGLSFAAPPNWQMNLQPFISVSNRKTASHASRIHYGETAVFFQATPTADPANSANANSIQLEGSPFLFRSLGRTLGSVRHVESKYRGMPGVKVLHSTRYYRLDDMDFAEFDLVDEAKQVLYHHVFARSGECRLDFVLTTSGQNAPPQFDEFVRSIKITRKPTCFND